MGERARSAADSAAKSETHDLVAKTAASLAHAAQLQVEFSTRANIEANPGIKELQLYCRRAESYLKDNPSHALDKDVMRIRKFCSGVAGSLDDASEVDRDPDIQVGYDLYFDPEKQYPVPPPKADGSGFDPRVHEQPTIRLSAPRKKEKVAKAFTPLE